MVVQNEKKNVTQSKKKNDFKKKIILVFISQISKFNVFESLFRLSHFFT